MRASLSHNSVPRSLHETGGDSGKRRRVRLRCSVEGRTEPAPRSQPLHIAKADGKVCIMGSDHCGYHLHIPPRCLTQPCCAWIL